ncbi:hypothetical protein DJ568_08640 [Mucilaginibacter hurinus]|uniref:Uncharacterized protein n=1 Tax=Mucilaginibacter hurinus TaxID=2201324 RepID=A0A367GRB1_9SPHI|nr:hypothetical protein [Mucilaginibacter hurinus]RCH55243.1 hypothetical protein DJ568_08640 [Mucilaginibacter hurinus]
MDMIEATLTGSDSEVPGTVRQIGYDGFDNAYEFTSIDGTLQLVIARDEDGHWVRVAGSEPYFSGWVDELVEQLKVLRVNG